MEFRSRSVRSSRDRVKSTRRESFVNLRSLMRARSVKKDFSCVEDSSSSASIPSSRVQSGERVDTERIYLTPSFRKKLAEIEDEDCWTRIHTRGDRPAPRFHHAAAVVGRKLIVIGGDTGSEMANDVQMLHLGKLSWSTLGQGATAPPKGLAPKTGPVQHLPKCRGHSLIPWGKTVLLIAGYLDPAEDKVAVWSFDLEMDCWTKVATKGEVPSSRWGQSVTRAGSILIMFGGEDSRGRKLNDLHILDLKSLMWLPLHTLGARPSPRSKHIAEMYDDRFLLVFGGATKSKISSDLYALDFDSMEWSRLKTKGLPPIPRAGHAGALVGDKWYIVGGEPRTSDTVETSVLNISNMAWSVVTAASPDTLFSYQGLSVVHIQRKNRKFLVAFGGRTADATNTVQVMCLSAEQVTPAPKTLAGLLGVPTTPDSSHLSAPDSHATRLHGSIPSLLTSNVPCACVDVARSNLVSVLEQRSRADTARRKSYTTMSVDENYDSSSGLIPLRKRYAMSQDSRRDDMSKRSESTNSVFSLALDTGEGKERQHESSQSNRVDLQSSTAFTDTGKPSSDDQRGSAPSVRPASSVIDTGTSTGKSQSSFPRKTGSVKGFSSSEIPDSGDVSMSSHFEETQFTSEQSVVASSGSLESCTSWMSTGWPSTSTTTSDRTTPEYEEDEVTILSKLFKAKTPELRKVEVSRLRKHHERKLAASVRKAEFVAGQLTEALKSKDEAERTLQTVLRSRQRAESRLAAALKEQKELRDSLTASMKTTQELSNSAHKARLQNLQDEHDLSVLKAILEETQKELQSTRGILSAERTKAFQLQVDLFDAKQKLQSLEPNHLQATRVQQPILA